MADNVAVTPGVGADIATDDVGGVHYQEVKIALGLADSVDTLLDSGQQTMANSLPVVLASNQTAVPVTASATDLDIRDLSKNQDSVLIYGSDDGGTTKRAIKTDAGGAIQVDLEVTNVVADTELTTADLDTGAGTDTRAVVGLVGSASGGGQLIPGSSADGLLVNLGANNDVTVTGTVTANAGTNLNTSALATQATLSTINTKLVSGTDIGDVTINNASGASAVNIQDGGNIITVDGAVSVSGEVDTELTTADLDTGAGTDTRAVIGLVGSASGGGQLIPGTSSGGLLVDLGTNNDVTITSGTCAVTQSGTWDEVGINDSNNSITVDAPVGTPAFVRLSDGAAPITTLPVSLASVPSHAVTNAGTFAVQVDGLALTSLQLADDVVATLGTTTYTEATTKGTIVGAVRRDADTTLVDTTNEIGPLQMDANGRLKVEAFSGEVLPVSGTVTANLAAGSNNIGDVDIVGGTVADSAADSGNPIKVGSRSVNALPTTLANNDRSDALSNLLGQRLVGHIDPAMQVHKSTTYTSQQTGSTLWDPTAGKRIAITSVIISTYATISGRIILWFGDNADTTFTEGTDQTLIRFSAALSGTSKPGLVYCPSVPIYCTTADRELHVTSDNAISFDIVVEGYEW